MDKVYIFGSDKFCNSAKSMLNNAGISNYETLEDVPSLKSEIEANPNKFYLIDHEKIFSPTIFTKYMKFLIPKNGVEKSYLDGYNLGSLEFSTGLKAIEYIKLRINEEIKIESNNIEDTTSQDEKFVSSMEDIDKSFDDFIEIEKEPIIEEPKERDLTQITDIDEIADHEMDSAIFDLDFKKG